MSDERFKDQKVLLLDGTRLEGKSVRIVNEDRFIKLGGSGDYKTLGEAKVNKKSIPVVRRRGRNAGWQEV